MIKTQIQIPDDLYRRVKRLAESQEWSLAETLRRAAELLLAVRSPGSNADRTTWRLDPPANTQLRSDPFADPDWRMHANLGSGASGLLKQSRK
ncbi:MAG: ribbon-helix-helix protein, CopG family [Planctomycetia bacterium]